jgi:hypothetical protein
MAKAGPPMCLRCRSAMTLVPAKDWTDKLVWRCFKCATDDKESREASYDRWSRLVTRLRSGL